ncbi:SHOCT domain-containing protein [Thermoplasma sp.]|uniref:SHOCT domain-containing protein n=1 Tax=Thermoplasma sp. TaxID=1973142 RepID=UPI00261DC763|nr:SHOCT domain-containing protein [Thermoplasma sp.]
MKNHLSVVIWALIAMIALVVILSVIPTIYYGVGYRGFGYGMMGYPYYGMYIFMPIMAIISILVIVLFIYLFFGAFSGIHDYDDRAEEILKERYARGEISKEEYEKRLEDLRR